MQVVSVTVDSFDFYCPVTGEKVFSEEDGFSPSPATKGYWVNETPFEPEICDDRLAHAWSEWVGRVDIDDELVGCIEFLEDYPSDSWVTFALHARGMPGDTGFLVIDLAGHKV